MSTAPHPSTPHPAEVADGDGVVAVQLARVARNPVVRTFDLTAAEPARKFAAHRSAVTELAQPLRSGDLLAVVQRAGGGRYWASEWTVGGRAESRIVVRRRAARGRSVEAAVSAMLAHPSFNNAHYFAPEEGLLGRFRR